MMKRKRKKKLLYNEKKKNFSLRINVQKDWLRNNTSWAPCGIEMKIKGILKSWFWISLHQGMQNSRLHDIFHEWSRSVIVASTVCFVWDAKPNFPTGFWWHGYHLIQNDFSLDRAPCIHLGDGVGIAWNLASWRETVFWVIVIALPWGVPWFWQFLHLALESYDFAIFSHFCFLNNFLLKS